MSRSYKNTVIAILLACILTMAIGYAVLNTRLSISGTSKITSDFNIQVTGISEFGVYGLASTANMDFTPTSATYSTNLQAPGDNAMYEIIIENKGSLPGYFEIATGGFNGFGDFNIYDDGNVSIGVLAVTNSQLTPTSANLDLALPGINYLNPGDKIYVYANVEFLNNVTSLPDKKEYSSTIDFNFYTKDYFGDDFVIKSGLLSTVLKNNQIVSSENGLYKRTSSDFGTIYTFKTNTIDNINNYVSIDGKLWRIIKMYYGIRNKRIFQLVAVDKTIGNVYSTIADPDGFYNSVEYSYSSLKQLFSNDYYFFEDTGAERSPNKIILNQEMWYRSEYPYLISLNDIIETTTSSECDIVGLTTGKCKSWLTSDDTYLLAQIYSDKETNTGNIAYLQDGSVISVDPRDINYANAREVITIVSYGCDIIILNSDTADGSYNNPYVVSMDENDWCESNT